MDAFRELNSWLIEEIAAATGWVADKRWNSQDKNYSGRRVESSGSNRDEA
jgi:hypothetical protein